LGPVYANFVLLDEINRSSAKTQSAMLEAMQERQTSIGGAVYKMPEVFLVIATQNPIEQEGTYILAEAQLDRFTMKELVDYPSKEEEVDILTRIQHDVFSAPVKKGDTATIEDVLFIQKICKQVYVDEAIKRYIVDIVQATRAAEKYISADLAKYIEFGSSPRGAIALMQVGQALALLNNRTHVIPEDIKQFRYSVLRHRINMNFEAIADGIRSETIIDAIFSSIPTP